MNRINPAPGQDSGRADESPIEVARGLLARHVHFGPRVDNFAFDVDGDVLIIEGSVPSFHLKQMLQTVLRDVQGVARIINRVEVIAPNGISSCSEQTRRQCALAYKRLGHVPLCFPTCDGIPGRL